jgi:hypothetical protein
MLTFIISVILVVVACLCFFKKNFWENRYLVLLISGCVALIATLTINFSIRGHLHTKTEVLWNRPMATFYLPAGLFKDSTATKTHFVKDYNYYDNHKAKEFYNTDTSKKKVPVTILLYLPKGKDAKMHVGIMKKNITQDYYALEDVYLVKSSADSIAYVSRKKLYYDIKSNNWIAGFSIPRINTITILHIPPTEFAMIPDSLIRKVPF